MKYLPYLMKDGFEKFLYEPLKRLLKKREPIIVRTSFDRKLRMRQIPGEAVVRYCEPLATKTPQGSSRRLWRIIDFPEG
jgi:hypothetical protein